MAYYSSLAEMFKKRAEKSKKLGDQHWAKAKNGEGNHHYGQAKRCYGQATTSQEKAEQSSAAGVTWKKR